MAGLFLCAWDSILDYLDYLDSIWGVNLGFLGFQLSSIWDSISESLVSILGLLPDGSGKVFLSTSDTQIVQT